MMLLTAGGSGRAGVLTDPVADLTGRVSGAVPLLQITLLDCVGVVGRSVFLFKVLPETNPLTAVVIGTAVCQVPGILKLTSLCLLRNTPQSEDTTSHRWLRVRRLVHAPLVALALAVQLLSLIHISEPTRR